MPDLLGFDDALERILAAARPLEAKMLPLARAAGHCLAEALDARLTQPPFDASAMDGYAVNAASVAPMVPLRLTGRSEAGSGFAGTLKPGEAVRIFTGAPVPQGADAVVMQEDATRDSDAIIISARPEPGQHIRKTGNDFAVGTPLIGKGARLTPAALSLAAAAGFADVSVVRRPRLALLATGDELVPPGTTPGPDQIVASNGVGLRALFSPFADTIDDYGIVRDNEADLRQCLTTILKSDADVVVTTGGASVGDKDLVKPVLAELGIALDLWRIAMRPGKPLMFARAGNKLVFGLPGNPVSALTTATVLVVPALRAVAGDTDPGPHYLTLPLAAPLGPNGPRRHFRRARLIHTPEGTGVAPIDMIDSAHLSSFAEADALIVQPENSTAQTRGTPVKVLILAS